MDEIIGELRKIYPDDVSYQDLKYHLNEADVDRWAATLDCPRMHLFDGIAMFLALGFHRSELSFEFCDAVVNDLFAPVTNTSGPKPEEFWEVYSAFDEGEYYHGNNQDEDPVDVYTRPMIARIVERNNSHVSLH